MTWSGCEDFLWWFCQRQAGDAQFRMELRAALEESNDPLGSVVRVIGATEPKMAAVAEMELGELPPIAIRTMLEAWREADDAGLHFEAHSVKPDRPIEFAKSRRVRVTVDREAEGVYVGLAHIPGRHPTGPAVS
jgi:hypothetical protein